MQPDTEHTKSVHSDSSRRTQFITPMVPMTPMTTLASLTPTRSATPCSDPSCACQECQSSVDVDRRAPSSEWQVSIYGELDMAHYRPISLPSRAVNSTASSISLYGFSSPDGKPIFSEAHHLLLSESQATSPAHPFYPLMAPTPLSITTPAYETPSASQNTIFRSSLLTLGTIFVLLLYLVTPVVTTLQPFFPSMWSRVLMSLELLALAEWLVVRVLLKTTKR